MYIPTEYAQIIEVNGADILKMKNAQYLVLDYVKGLKTYKGLINGLGACASILGVIFYMLYTSVCRTRNK